MCFMHVQIVGVSVYLCVRLCAWNRMSLCAYTSVTGPLLVLLPWWSDVEWSRVACKAPWPAIAWIHTYVMTWPHKWYRAHSLSIHTRLKHVRHLTHTNLANFGTLQKWYVYAPSRRIPIWRSHLPVGYTRVGVPLHIFTPCDKNSI